MEDDKKEEIMIEPDKDPIIKIDIDKNSGRLNPFVALAIGLICGALFTVIIMTAIGNDPEAVAHVCETTQDMELIFIAPSGCTELCDNLTVAARALAAEVGVGYKDLQLDANFDVPGAFIMGGNKITQTIPFDSEFNLRAIMCREWKYEQLCTPEILDLTTGNEG